MPRKTTHHSKKPLPIWFWNNDVQRPLSWFPYRALCSASVYYDMSSSWSIRGIRPPWVGGWRHRNLYGSSLYLVPLGRTWAEQSRDRGQASFFPWSQVVSSRRPEKSAEADTYQRSFQTQSFELQFALIQLSVQSILLTMHSYPLGSSRYQDASFIHHIFKTKLLESSHLVRLPRVTKLYPNACRSKVSAMSPRRSRVWYYFQLWPVPRRTNLNNTISINTTFISLMYIHLGWTR